MLFDFPEGGCAAGYRFAPNRRYRPQSAIGAGRFVFLAIRTDQGAVHDQLIPDLAVLGLSVLTATRAMVAERVVKRQQRKHEDEDCHCGARSHQQHSRGDGGDQFTSVVNP